MLQFSLPIKALLEVFEKGHVKRFPKFSPSLRSRVVLHDGRKVQTSLMIVALDFGIVSLLFAVCDSLCRRMRNPATLDTAYIRRGSKLTYFERFASR